MTIMERMRKGSRFFPSGSNAVVDARDVATALVRLLDERPDPGEPMGIGERLLLIGENISYRGLFGIIAETAGLPAPTTPLPPWMLGLAWRIERLRTLFGGRPMITKVSARTASRPRLYDGSKARRLLDMEFSRAKEAVENTERFLRAQ
jgi:nucleoside-diphosphate-sugar epimerase